MTDIETVEQFIREELAVRIQSSEPEPDEHEKEDIEEANAALAALKRIEEDMNYVSL